MDKELINLCETCKFNYPECGNVYKVAYGDGWLYGNDNIIECKGYIEK